MQCQLKACFLAILVTQGQNICPKNVCKRFGSNYRLKANTNPAPAKADRVIPANAVAPLVAAASGPGVGPGVSAGTTASSLHCQAMCNAMLFAQLNTHNIQMSVLQCHSKQRTICWACKHAALQSNMHMTVLSMLVSSSCTSNKVAYRASKWWHRQLTAQVFYCHAHVDDINYRQG